MTPRQRKALGRQIVAVAQAIGLKDWTFLIATEPEGREGVLASVECTYGRRIATLAFRADWWEHEAHERHHVVVHELLHIVTDPIRTYLGETLPVLIGQPAFVAVHEAVRQHEEHAVDQLASALAPYLPVSEEP